MSIWDQDIIAQRNGLRNARKPIIISFTCVDEQRYYVSVVPKSEEVKVTKPRQTIRLLLRHRIGLSAIKMVVKCSGDADRHFLTMMLLFRLARKIVLKSLPTMI